MIRALLAAAFCFFVGTASAANIDPRLAKYDVCGRFEVFHINGIMTTRIQAGQNRDRIRVVYGNAYNGHLIFYGLGYNQTRGFATDLYQSALQVISGYAGATWDKFMNAVTFSVYSIGMPEATAKAIAKVVTDKYAFTKPSPYQDQDLTDIMNEINSQTAGGANAYHKARKVFVPHSQGNLYMNLVYDKLIANGTPAASMGVVGMAVPYSSVRSGNTYVTSWNDVVVDATRVADVEQHPRPERDHPVPAERRRIGPQSDCNLSRKQHGSQHDEHTHHERVRNAKNDRDAKRVRWHVHRSGVVGRLPLCRWHHRCLHADPPV